MVMSSFIVKISLFFYFFTVIMFLIVNILGKDKVFPPTRLLMSVIFFGTHS